MSFQNTKAFPTLQAQQVKQAPVAVKSPATPFLWAKLGNGEKKDIVAVQAEEKAKKEAAELARLEKEKKLREDYDRELSLKDLKMVRLEENKIVLIK